MRSLTGLRLFVAVIERGTLGAAAEHLSLSPPAASRQIAQLEDELGLPLFERHRQRLLPTDEALAFYPEARHIVAAVDDVPDVVARLRAGGTTPLRLIAMPKLARTLVADAMARFEAAGPVAAPGVRIALESRSRVEMERALATGQFHLGFGSLPVSSEAFAVEPLCTAPLRVVVPADREAALRGDGPGGLPDLPWVALWRRSPVRQQVDRLLEARGERLEPRIEVSNADLAVALVAAGRGFTVMDDFGIDDARRPHVATGPVPGDPSIRYAVLRPHRAREHAASDAFAACVREACAARLGPAAMA